VRWDDLQERQPRLGAIAHERLITPGVLQVVTIRADGTPRLSPVEPFVLDGELWLSMMLGSRKAADLQRDPRVLVHSIVTGPSGEEGELKLRGVTREVTDEPTQRRYAEAVSEALPWSPEVGRFHLFAVDIHQVTYLRYDNASGDQYLVLWPPGRETVRRGTSATTVGEPEHIRDVLV
jgi:pyridoxamine 5'-phosphate oxidase-like protein